MPQASHRHQSSGIVTAPWLMTPGGSIATRGRCTTSWPCGVWPAPNWLMASSRAESEITTTRHRWRPPSASTSSVSCWVRRHYLSIIINHVFLAIKNATNYCCECCESCQDIIECQINAFMITDQPVTLFAFLRRRIQRTNVLPKSLLALFTDCIDLEGIYRFQN